ncbi:MAG: hypothetical protein GY703_11785 [Gammaproteobacteria bacterium]|nr:hypothetical protein [Gammaproteobacteria bacterium]
MHTHITLPTTIIPKLATDMESLDELWADEEFWVEFIDQINQNFVIEVKEIHGLAEFGRENTGNGEFK